MTRCSASDPSFRDEHGQFRFELVRQFCPGLMEELSERWQQVHPQAANASVMPYFEILDED
eukprot:1164802-Alexandrium_andersonii.AAC.1